MRSNPPHRPNSNVNVTLGFSGPNARRTFPCPLCMTELDLRKSRANKPYCVCNSCGVQLFFRGRKGIARLGDFTTHGGIAPIPLEFSNAVDAFAHVERLRAHIEQLQDKQPLIFSDKDLDNAIQAVNLEIARTRQILERFASPQTDPQPQK